MKLHPWPERLTKRNIHVLGKDGVWMPFKPNIRSEGWPDRRLDFRHKPEFYNLWWGIEAEHIMAQRKRESAPPPPLTPPPGYPDLVYDGGFVGNLERKRREVRQEQEQEKDVEPATEGGLRRTQGSRGPVFLRRLAKAVLRDRMGRDRSVHVPPLLETLDVD